jgi:hypothetical protein
VVSLFKDLRGKTILVSLFKLFRGKAVVKPVVSFVLILFVLSTGCQGRTTGLSADSGPPSPITSGAINPLLILPAPLDKFPTINGRNPAVENTYQPLAESSSLRLYVNQASSAIIVEDKRSGSLWRSSPADLSVNKEPTTAWRKQIEAPVQVTFVDAERSQPKNIKPDSVKLEYKPVEGGVTAVYRYPTSNLAFAVTYAIKDDCLEATVPDASIVEDGKNSLVAIDLLPFLGAAHDGDSLTHVGEDSYIVYPDGSGALMYFKPSDRSEVQKINSIVYGTDASGGLGGPGGVYREQVVIPVFGLAAAQSAFVGIITHGDFDASIAVARSGKGINYNHVWGQFIFRRQGRFSLTGGQPTWLFQGDRIGGDRQVRYCFLNGLQADYIGMASRYRQFLIDERGAKRIGSNQPLINLAFFMGIERKTWFLSDMISMTTFAQVKDMLDDLSTAGVKRADILLWNWNLGGTAGHYPQRLPVDKRLGGEKDLRTLAGAIHDRGQRLFLQDNYLGSAPGAAGVMPYLDAIRGVDGLPIGDSDNGYLLNPQVSLRRFAARDIPRMAAFGADGLELESFASMAIPDKNLSYPLSREGFAASWMQIASLSRQQFGSAAMIGSNTYAVPYTDRLDFVTVDSTHYDFFDETIPFYHIAVHGLVQYSGSPINLEADGKRMFLRGIEYGATPFFILTHDSSAKLARTGADSVYSSEFGFWQSEVIRQYGVMQKLSPLTNQFITGHTRLADSVYQTTYEDGTRVIVNYNLQDFLAGNLNVPAQDFVVVQGE